MAGVKSKTLNSLTWDGRSKGALWTMLGPDGKDAKSGSPIGAFAQLNKKGRRAADIIAELEEHRYICLSTLKEVRAENERVLAQSGKVEKALKAASRKQKNFLTLYLNEVENAENAGAKITTAEERIIKATIGLGKSRNKLKQFKIDQMKKKTEDERAKLKDERDKAVASLNKFLGFAKVLQRGDFAQIPFLR